MLIEFSVTNFGSILDRQTLSMSASSYFKEMEDQNTITSEKETGFPRLLRSAVLYGPNASGKTTLIQALDFFQNQVINSQKESQAGDPIDVTPFKLTAESRVNDSEFEIIFISQDVRYQYGFKCNKTRFTEEWLYAYPLGRAQKWFHRVYENDTEKYHYRFSQFFLGGQKKQVWLEQTRQNALFLSTSIQLNNEQLMPVFDWFKSKLRIIESVGALGSRYTLTHCKDLGYRKRVINFMNSAGLNIADIKPKEIPFSTDLFPSGIPGALIEELAKDMAGKKIIEPVYYHKDAVTEEPIEFDETEESDGTRTLFAFSGPWLDVLENERILVVDELDSSLHPLLVHHLVGLLHKENTKAQLIFTTHDTTLLSQKLLRRDQVWFVEKDKNSATNLYPLSDFGPRENEAIERGYLNGRYGGIPFLQNLDFYGV